MTAGRKFHATPFVAVPVWVLDRLAAEPDGAVCIAVYVALRRHASNDTDEAWPSRERIGEQIGKSRATVERAYSTLERLGCIERLGQARSGADRWSTQRVWMPTDPARP